MKTLFTLISISLFSLSSFLFPTRLQHPNHHFRFIKRDTIQKKGYTLIFINKDSTFEVIEKKRLIKTFFAVYPKEVEDFNPNSEKKVTFIIDPDYDGVAATGNATTQFNSDWFKSHPEDIDVVTHEAMHIVQNYEHGDHPGWLTEGIADYVRYIYGVNNKNAQWALPDYNPDQSYENAYRVTARFLVWVSRKKNKNLVKQLDSALREGTYQPNLWKELTGSTLKQLWSDYSKNPSLELHYH